MPQIIELGVFVSALALAISSAIVSHVRKTMTSAEEALANDGGDWHWFQYGFSCGSAPTPHSPLHLSRSLCLHPLHTHVRVAKFKQLLPANAFNGKISFVAPNGAVAKVSFCLVSFRFILLRFISLLFSLCFSPLQIFIEFE